jgi:hypothetical protein
MSLYKRLRAAAALIALNVIMSCVLLAANMPIRNEQYRLLGMAVLGGISGSAIAFFAELWLRSRAVSASSP